MLKSNTRLLLLSALVALAGACADDDTGLCAENGVSVTIADNHPTGSHSLDVSASDVERGDEQTFDIQGSNTGHGHTVIVSSDDFSAIWDGVVVTITSSDTGAAGMDHTHEVTLDCNPPGA